MHNALQMNAESKQTEDHQTGYEWRTEEGMRRNMEEGMAKDEDSKNRSLTHS